MRSLQDGRLSDVRSNGGDSPVKQKATSTREFTPGFVPSIPLMFQLSRPKATVNKSTKGILGTHSTGERKIQGDFCTNKPKGSTMGIEILRRVAVVREYPPFCGRNASCPTEEERIRLDSENKVKSQEINGDADREEYLKKRKFEEKTTAQLGLGNSSVGRRASTSRDTSIVSDSNSSINGVQNARVREMETLALFRAVCEDLEAKKVGTSEKVIRRVDFEAAKVIRESGKEVNTYKQWIGSVPGVEVGDEFLYRVELVSVGIHRLYEGGIDYIKDGSKIIATSIIASEGGYSDDRADPEVLIYSGQGGNITGRNDEPPKDQKLEKGNLALKNCISSKTPVRVTRGYKKNENSGRTNTRLVTYTYDGLYMVEKYWCDVGPHEKIVYMFELKRVPGQPKVAWKTSEVQG